MCKWTQCNLELSCHVTNDVTASRLTMIKKKILYNFLKKKKKDDCSSVLQLAHHVTITRHDVIDVNVKSLMVVLVGEANNFGVCVAPIQYHS